MKALALTATESTWPTTRGLEIIDTPKPTLNETENPKDSEAVIVKLALAGFCGSDKGIWFRSSFRDLIFSSMKKDGRKNLILGHELLGTVVEVGSQVPSAYRIHLGDTVSTESHIFCGSCYQCRIGQENVCANEKIIGISDTGGFAEYIKLPARVLWKTDLNRIRPEVAALQEPLGNAVFACQKVDLRGRTVAIFGLGTIGLFAVLVARALGASKIIGIEPLQKNRELAERLGIDHTIAIDLEKAKHAGWHPDAEVVTLIREFTHGEGVDVTIEMSGQNANINSAVRATRRGGDIVLFGIQGGNFVFERFEEVIVQGISFHSVIGRDLFKTWYTVRNLLESVPLGIADQIYSVILNRGEGTVVPFSTFNAVDFEKRITSHPKILIEFNS